jgi:hypothetical protein
MFTDGTPDRRPPLWLVVLGAAVAVAALATAAVVALGARSSTPTAEPPASPTTAPAPTTTPVPVATTSSTVSPSSSAPSTMALPGPDRHAAAPADRDAVVAATQRFVTGWLLPGSPEERTAALTGTATGALVDLLAPVPPENLPAGPPPTAVDVVQISDLAAVAAVQLADGTPVQVELVNTAVGWQVTSVKRVRA